MVGQERSHLSSLWMWFPCAHSVARWWQWKKPTDLFCTACAAYLSGLERNLHAATGSIPHANWGLGHLLCFPSCNVSFTGAAASAGSWPLWRKSLFPLLLHGCASIDAVLSLLLTFSLSIHCPMVYCLYCPPFPLGFITEISALDLALHSCREADGSSVCTCKSCGRRWELPPGFWMKLNQKGVSLWRMDDGTANARHHRQSRGHRLRRSGWQGNICVILLLFYVKMNE